MNKKVLLIYTGVTIGMAKVRTEFSAARMAEQFDEAMQLTLKKE